MFIINIDIDMLRRRKWNIFQLQMFANDFKGKNK